jgi:phage portal protein BeeE
MGLKNFLGNLPLLWRNSNHFFHQNLSFLNGHKGAVWIETDKPAELYNTIGELKTVIDKKCLMFSNAEVILVDDKGQRVDDEAFKNLMQSPNPTQKINEFLFNYKQHDSVYGNSFMLKVIASRLQDVPSNLWMISPAYIKPYLSGKVFQQTSMMDIVNYYEYNDNVGRMEKFDTDKVLWMRRTDIDNPLIGCSPIKALRYPITNTKLAYEFRNSIMGNLGALGIYSNQGKDSMGAMPLEEKERLRLEKEFVERYGAQEGKSKVILTNAALKFQANSYPTKDLLLFEEVDANKMAMIDHFGLNVNIFSNRNATFENVKNSIKHVYQDTIIPEADKLAQEMTKFLGFDKKKLSVKLSYDYLPIMQEDKSVGLDSVAKKVEVLTNLVTLGVITPARATEMLNNELNNLLMEGV